MLCGSTTQSWSPDIMWRILSASVSLPLVRADRPNEEYWVQNVFCKLFIASFTFSDIFLQTYVIFLLIPIGPHVYLRPNRKIRPSSSLDRPSSSHDDNLLMKLRFKEGFTIVQLPCCFAPASTGKIIMAFSKFGEKNLLPSFSFTLKEKPSICCKMLIWLVGLGIIKRETACHNLLSQPDCKIFYLHEG